MPMKMVSGPPPKNIKKPAKKVPVRTTVIKHKPTKRFVQKILTEQGEIAR